MAIYKKGNPEKYANIPTPINNIIGGGSVDIVLPYTGLAYEVTACSFDTSQSKANTLKTETGISVGTTPLDFLFRKFYFSIPKGKTITGIKVSVRMKRDTGNINVWATIVKNFERIDAGVKNAFSSSTSATTFDLGGAGDMWSIGSLTSDDLNNSFAIQVTMQSTASSTVYWVKCELYYS